MLNEFSKNLVVLGANSDIGSVLVERASQQPDANILAVSHQSPLPASADRENVERHHGIDLSDESHLNSLAKLVERKFNGPFGVVHSVGHFWIHKSLVETSFTEIVAMIKSQVLTLFGVARFLTPIMIKNKGGRIVTFSCNSVGFNYPDMSPFTASKAAIESFVKCYANEHAEFGISACALALPTIRTPKVLKEKANGDHANYITPEQLVDFIINHVLTQPHEVNGNVIKLFKHSPTFYHSSYYDRNPRRDGSPKSKLL
ncbi:MAG: family oxidoreductase [Pedosphaera sp.]|nr:family oxidoreductase [Pedosphaera sp.]